MLLRRVEVDAAVVDVRLLDGCVAAVGSLHRENGEMVVDGQGGALLPGLHDHHLHLMAMAAALVSVDVSTGLEGLLPGSGWLRGVGWTGDGDRHDIDRVLADRPVRLQHRSGALWVVNSAGVDALGLRGWRLPGIERDEAGEPTGRLWRLDRWLAERWGVTPPDLAAVGNQLAQLGITGATDATPDLDVSTCELLRQAIPQRLLLLGDPHGSGPAKLVLPDHELPPFDALVDELRRIRPRPVAVHCVTREALLLLLAALDEVGRLPGDRVEHASLVPAEVLPAMPICVTQPGFLATKGDDYLRDVQDLDDLYRYRSLLEARVAVVPSSDAPYGPIDPWAVLRAARDRTAPSGRVVGSAERVPVAAALEGMLRPLDDPAAPARRVEVGAPADLVLLRTGLAQAMAEPSAERVRRTWIRGEVVA